MHDRKKYFILLFSYIPIYFNGHFDSNHAKPFDKRPIVDGFVASSVS
jgi:hypothetical protein